MRPSVIASAVFLLAATLTGCSGDSQSPSADPEITQSAPSESVTPQPRQRRAKPCGIECSGREVPETGCDDGTTVSIGDSPTLYFAGGALEGVLELRFADPSVCKRHYWARFTPEATNTKAWTVTIESPSRQLEDQDSVSSRPKEVGFTEGILVPAGETVEYCLKSRGIPDQCFEHATPPA